MLRQPFMLTLTTALAVSASQIGVFAQEVQVNQQTQGKVQTNAQVPANAPTTGSANAQTRAAVNTEAGADNIAAATQADTEVLMRGPLHEAFATVSSRDPVTSQVVNKKPPEPLNELLPEYKPAGNVQWIPGYWAFDSDREDYIWISGLWRNPPPGRQWVPGYWQEVEGGYRWNQGVWVAAGEQVGYYPAPPESQEHGPSSRRPSDQHFYVPGCWVYTNAQYQWRPGYWAPYQNNWVWVPARYTQAGNAYLYSDGYWDYALASRGQPFAPVYFRNQAYTNANFRYRPVGVIDVGSQLLLHMFVQPQAGQFYFGDYYDARYANRGYLPWYTYAGAQNTYDPLLAFYATRNGGNFVNRLQGWTKYFTANEQYRPAPTLSGQLAFANEHADFQYLSQTMLGNTLENVVNNAASTARFAPVTNAIQQQISGVTQQIQGLTNQRLNLETGVQGQVNSTLQLPQRALNLPRIPVLQPDAVTPNVPDNPINLRNVVPRQLPVQPQLPVDIPNLPQLPF